MEKKGEGEDGVKEIDCNRMGYDFCSARAQGKDRGVDCATVLVAAGISRLQYQTGNQQGVSATKFGGRSNALPSLGSDFSRPRGNWDALIAGP